MACFICPDPPFFFEINYFIPYHLCLFICISFSGNLNDPRGSNRPRELHGLTHPAVDGGGKGQVASSELTLAPDEVLGSSASEGADLLVECYASHPGLGADLVAYAHVVEVLCKLEYAVNQIP